MNECDGIERHGTREERRSAPSTRVARDLAGRIVCRLRTPAASPCFLSSRCYGAWNPHAQSAESDDVGPGPSGVAPEAGWPDRHRKPIRSCRCHQRRGTHHHQRSPRIASWNRPDVTDTAAGTDVHFVEYSTGRARRASWQAVRPANTPVLSSGWSHGREANEAWMRSLGEPELANFSKDKPHTREIIRRDFTLLQVLPSPCREGPVRMLNSTKAHTGPHPKLQPVHQRPSQPLTKKMKNRSAKRKTRSPARER